MPNFGVSLFEHMLTKQAAQEQQRRQDERLAKQDEMGMMDRVLAGQQRDDQRQDAEFDRQFKVAGMLGKSAGLRGERAPAMKSGAAQEYADAGAGEGGYTMQKFLQEQGMEGAKLRDRQEGREYDADVKFALQDDEQDAKQELESGLLEPGRNKRARMISEAQRSSKALSDYMRALGMKVGLAKELHANDPIDRMMDPEGAAQSQSVMEDLLRELENVPGGRDVVNTYRSSKARGDAVPDNAAHPLRKKIFGGP